MKAEDKELLLKDLSARLPYGVKVKIESEDSAIESGTLVGMTKAQKHDTIIYEDLVCLAGVLTPFRLEEVKPYLRSMASMTEDEIKEFYKANGWNDEDFRGEHYYPDCCLYFTRENLEWLKTNHFDYNNLITRGLAIKVTEDNNPYK